MLSSPLDSLVRGNWFKLICGASYQHLPSIRNLALVYTLAGADCLDLAADKAVVYTAIEGIEAARQFRDRAIELGYNPHHTPLLMISINDGEDPHFRKAKFKPTECLIDCHRPCQTICPVDAIAFPSVDKGVIEQLCYGCGRCLPVCPVDIIDTESKIIGVAEVLEWLDVLPIKAIEIHTQQGHLEHFKRVWQSVKPYLAQLKLIAISCPYTPTVTEYLTQIDRYIHSSVDIPLIWQTDGRPMSGDIGSGTTHLTIKYAQQVKNLKMKGFIQLAGGTNQYTVSKLRSLNLISSTVAGIAYGSQGRKQIADILSQLESICEHNRLEDYPHLLWQAVTRARELIAPLKELMKQ